MRSARIIKYNDENCKPHSSAKKSVIGSSLKPRLGFPCPQCPKTLKTKVTLEIHMGCKHDGSKRKCPECDFVAADPAKIFRHRCAEHDYKPTRSRGARASLQSGMAKVPIAAEPLSVPIATLLSFASIMNPCDFCLLQPILHLVPLELIMFALSDFDVSRNTSDFWAWFSVLLDTTLQHKIARGMAFSDLGVRQNIVKIMRSCSSMVPPALSQDEDSTRTLPSLEKDSSVEYLLKMAPSPETSIGVLMEDPVLETSLSYDASLASTVDTEDNVFNLLMQD